MSKQHVVSDEKGNILEFGINKRKWGMNYLYNPNNHKKCCLGFLGCAMNIPLDYMDSFGTFDENNSMVEQLPSKMKKILVNQRTNYFGDRVTESTKFVDALVAINDDEKLTWKQKEEKITKKFAKKGIKVVFTG